MDRRQFLRAGAAAAGATAGAAALGPSFWLRALAATASPGPGPYGPLRPADPNGIRLPAGFSARGIARSLLPVPGTLFPWHLAPDGGATFPTSGGGWIYVSNSEVPLLGGASAIAFAPNGSVRNAYRVLRGTSLNCAGGPTPWGTWLSCEEHDLGRVWECDPTRPSQGVVRPALGVFTHEAAAVDPVGRSVYLTEDRPDGRLYRFTPERWPSLDRGRLDAAQVRGAGPGGTVDWLAVANPNGVPPTRTQVPASTPFNGGEGAWYAGGVVYFTTKGDNRVWSYTVDGSRLSVVYDDDDSPDAPLHGVDNVTVSRSGDLYVAEDGDDMQICVISRDGMVAPFLQVLGHDSSEITGPAFNPAGERLYFSSQRGTHGLGITYEVVGPFRT
ncbi:MAG TPA: alkaline phosphatase PhoX [Acidimicrobiales bacterium]|nr:alkaline phosphatase PhoX [Acidimicrobiales bacterium]